MNWILTFDLSSLRDPGDGQAEERLAPEGRQQPGRGPRRHQRAVMKNGERREQSTQAAKIRLQQNLTRRSLVMAENFETKKKKKNGGFAEDKG